MTAPPMAIAAVEVVGVGEHHVDRHQAPVVAVRRVREPAALGVLVVLHHLEGKIHRVDPQFAR